MRYATPNPECILCFGTGFSRVGDAVKRCVCLPQKTTAEVSTLSYTDLVQASFPGFNKAKVRKVKI